MSDIFISYSSADRPRVKPLVDALQQHGWSVWWDNQIRAGRTFDRVIEAAIRQARCVIVLWSRDSVESDWVRTEADEGKRRGILVPALLDQVDIPLAFKRIQAASLVGWSGALPSTQFDELASAVSEVLSCSGSPVSDATTSDTQQSVSAATALEVQRKTAEIEIREAEFEHQLLEKEREQAAAEKARLEQLERDHKTAEEEASLADVKPRRATARQFHLVQAHKPTPEVIGPLTRKYPAWMKVGIAVGAVLLIGSLLYWAASRSRTNGSEGQKPETQSTQNQAIQPQTTTLPQSVAGAASVGTIEGKVSTGNSVVYADTTTIPRKTFPASAQKAVMDQFRLEFKPHVMVIQQGTTVEFLNSDVVQHNVFWPSIGGKTNEFLNLGTWSKGEKRTYKFDTPGVAELLCNVHPEMSAYIVISPTPYFAETDADGNYKIENVPNGTYIVYAWHEGMKQQHQLVEVAGTSKVDFSLSK